MHLFTSRRFLPLFVTQFLGAFNDNMFKNALVMLVMFKVQDSFLPASQLIIMAGALFILPFLLFSSLAGQVADKRDRAQLARLTKLWEIALVVLGAIGFFSHHVGFLLFVLFGLGVQATFFGPVKYALLPQHLRDDELVLGNALIEAATFLAILLGTILGGVLIMLPGGEGWIVAATVAIALAGYAASRFIPAAPPPAPALQADWNILKATWRMVQHDRTNARVFRAIILISWFWLLGAVFLSQFPTLVKDVMGGNAQMVTLLLAMFSVGIGAGSMLASALARGTISAVYVPYAAYAMALFTLDFAWTLHHFSLIRLLADVALIAISAGVYVVPLYAIMQHDSDVQFRARTIATNNVLNAVFMVASAGATAAWFDAGGSMMQLFMVLALATALVGLYAGKTSW